MKKGKQMKRKVIYFKHAIEDLKFYNGDHETAQADQKEDGKKNAIGPDKNADHHY